MWLLTTTGHAWSQARYSDIPLESLITHFHEWLEQIDSFSGGPRWVDDTASLLVRNFLPWGDETLPQ